jgi:hypothetical protein
MERKTLSQKAVEIAAAEPKKASGNVFKRAKAQLKELLKPKDDEINIKEVKWRERKSSW